MEDPHADFPEMVGVFDTSDGFALGMAASALDLAGIIYDIIAVPDVSLNAAPADPKWWTRPQRILVSREDEAEALAVVEPFKYPLDDNGAEGLETQN